MHRLARVSTLALPAIAFGLVTNFIPALRPTTEAASAPQAIRSDPMRVRLMNAHYHQVVAMQDALIKGELSAIAPAAKALAQQDGPTGLPDAATSYVAAMKQTAARAAATATLSDASTETASMLVTCGECHRAVGTRPALPVPPAPVVGGVVGHMLEHQRAIDQMLQGLIVPSDTLWREGANGLKTAPLHRSDLPRDSKLTRGLMAAEKRVHQLAADAASMSEPATRAKSYAQILTTCAECHGLHRKIWGPSRP
jgi:cytochrome c553